MALEMAVLERRVFDASQSCLNLYWKISDNFYSHDKYFLDLTVETFKCLTEGKYRFCGIIQLLDKCDSNTSELGQP